VRQIVNIYAGFLHLGETKITSAIGRGEYLTVSAGSSAAAGWVSE
jgi:hypothetical protein